MKDKKNEQERGCDAAPIPFKRERSVPPASEHWEGDGVDPRLEHRKREFQKESEKPDYSAQRLGHRIKEVLSIDTVLPSIPELESFNIAEVSFNGAGNCFTVLVYCADPRLSYDPGDISEILKRQKGWLRSNIAESIKRKRVPDIVFAVLPPGVQP
jgi:hypothetical protein